MTRQRATAGQTSLAVGTGREGPNWVMLAGGAIVMALSLVIGRKQRQLQKEQARDKSLTKKKNRPQPDSGLPLNPSPSSLAAGPCSQSIKTDIAMKATEEKHVQADGAHEDRTCSSVISHLQLHSLSSKCIGDNMQSALPLSPSPPCSPKIFCLERRGLQGTLPARIEGFQSESYMSSALRAGLSAKTGIVQKLRQQIKTQDGIIFDLQAQLADQDQVIAIYHAHILDLREHLDVTRKENMDPNCEACRSCHAESNCVRPAMRSENSGREDIDAVIAEVWKLEEEVKSLKKDKMEQEIANRAMNIQHESLIQKVVKMETELKEAKMLASQKQQLIEKYECECFNYQIALEELQHRLDAETMDNEFLRTTKLIGLSDTSSANTIWKWSESLEPPKSTNTHDNDVSSKRCTVVDNGGSSHEGNVMRSYNVLFSSNSHQLGSNNISSSGGGSRSTIHGATTSKGAQWTGISDSEFTDDATNGTIIENLLATLQQEVEQVTAALAIHWKVVSEKRDETSCIVSEFQKRIAMNSDVHEAGSSGAQDWGDLSYTPGNMSTAQVQELSHKLEQIAKKQRIDEDLMELTKHQVKIAELKRQVSKLTSKCHVLSITHSSPDEEGTCDQHDPGVTSVVFDLADKLDEQEEQAKQMSMEVLRLSASFQLSSPYVPKSKKEELRKLFQGDDMQQGHRESSSKNQRTKSSDLQSVKPRYTVFQEEELEENCGGFLDTQFSLTTLKRVDAGNERNEDVELWSPIMVASKLGRRTFSNGVKSNNHPPVYDGSESDLPQDVSEFSKCNSLFKGRHHQPVHIKFSPEEVTSRFSFRTARNMTTPDLVVNSGPDNMNFRPLSTFDKDITVASDSPEVTCNAHDCLSVSKPSCCVQGKGGSCSLHSQDNAVVGFDNMGGMEAEIRRLQRDIEQVMVETSAVADISSPKPGQNFSPKCKENLSPVFMAKYAPFFSEKVSPLSDNNNSPLALPGKTTRLAFPEQKSSQALNHRFSPATDEQFSLVNKESQMMIAFDASTDQKSSSLRSESTIPMSRVMLFGEKKFADLDASISSSSMAALLDERSASSPVFNDRLSPAFDSKTSPAVRVGSPTILGSVTPRFFGQSEADGTSLRRSLFKSNTNSLSGDSVITPCLYGSNEDDKTGKLRRY